MKTSTLRKIIREEIKSTIKEKFEWDDVLRSDGKWDQLEKDVSNAIRPLVDKHSKNFGKDSYAVIDAIYQVMDGMFQKIK
jgi:phage tail tape-measure protein